MYLAVRGAPCLSSYPHVVDWVHRIKGFSEHTQNRCVVLSAYTCTYIEHQLFPGPHWLCNLQLHLTRDIFHTYSWRTPRSVLRPSSLSGSGGNQHGSPLLVTSPPRSPLPRPPILPSQHSSPHRLHTSTLSPRRHFSPLHHSLNASSSATPSRLRRSVTPRPRQVLPSSTGGPQTQHT